MKPGAVVTEEQIYRGPTLGGDVELACGHRSAGIIRRSGSLYYCSTCRSAQESIASVQSRRRFEASA